MSPGENGLVAAGTKGLFTDVFYARLMRQFANVYHSAVMNVLHVVEQQQREETVHFRFLRKLILIRTYSHFNRVRLRFSELCFDI